MKENPWALLLAYVTGLINQELSLKNEYQQPRMISIWVTIPARENQ